MFHVSELVKVKSRQIRKENLKKHCPSQYNLQGCVAVVDVVAVELV